MPVEGFSTIGKAASHHRISETLGGGMSVVCKAEDIKLKRTVVLKSLPQELCQDRMRYAARRGIRDMARKPGTDCRATAASRANA
jgi:hypothetical protein